MTDGLSSFRAFFPGIVAHKITEAFRGVGRKGAHWVAEPPDSPIPHDEPERRPLAPGVGERPGRQLHRLTPRQRAVLVLRIRSACPRRRPRRSSAPARVPCGSSSTGR